MDGQSIKAYEEQQRKVDRAREELPPVETLLSLDELQVSHGLIRARIRGPSMIYSSDTLGSCGEGHVAPGSSLLRRRCTRRSHHGGQPQFIPQMSFPAQSSDGRQLCIASDYALRRGITAADIHLPSRQCPCRAPGRRDDLGQRSQYVFLFSSNSIDSHLRQRTRESFRGSRPLRRCLLGI